MTQWTVENNLHISGTDRKNNRAIDVTPHIKRTPKGQDYIAWSVAQDLLMNYNDKLDVGYEMSEEGLPYITTSTGVYIKAYVYDRTTGKRTPSFIFPCRVDRGKGESAGDFAQRHLTDVSASSIGNDLQRAYAKVIAIYTGLAWSLYSKYDDSIEALMEEQQPTAKPSVANNQTPPPARTRPIRPVENEALDF